MKNQFKDEQIVRFSLSTFKKVFRFVRILGNKTYFLISKVDLPQVIWKLFPKKKIYKIQYRGRMGLKFLFVLLNRFLHLCCIFNRSLFSLWFVFSHFLKNIFDIVFLFLYRTAIQYHHHRREPLACRHQEAAFRHHIESQRERMRGWTSDQGEVISTNGFTCCHARPDGWDKSQLL